MPVTALSLSRPRRSSASAARSYRDDCLRSIDDRLKHALEAQRRSNLVADGVQRLENFDFALGHQQTCVVQRVRRCARKAREDEEIVVVEGFAFVFVDRFDAADERVAIHHGHGE